MSTESEAMSNTPSEQPTERPSERKDYKDFGSGFNQVILEESFVLNLKTTMSFVDFKMSFAINENYPLYTPPEPRYASNSHTSDDSDGDNLWEEDDACYDEEVQTESSDASSETDETDDKQSLYSYRTGRLFFPNMEQVRWQSRVQPYIDPATGSVDYGAIDYFYLQDGCYYLAGFWGELEIISAPPILEIDELKEWTQAQKEKSLNP